MTGIYKITNKINGHSYVGQSRNIQKRWTNEKGAAFNKNDKSYNYPLSRAIRKYGLENFSFEVIEECSEEELNVKENYWIKFYKSEYNQTFGEEYQVHGSKLNQEQVKEIQQILIDDIKGLVNHKKLAERFNVSSDTIQGINSGRIWYNSTLSYPLHTSIYSIKKEWKCIDCGKDISRGSTRCVECEKQNRISKRKNTKILTREGLKQLIRTTPFIKIGEKYGVTDNAIRKWCDKFNLPQKAREIKKYSDEEWEKI